MTLKAYRKQTGMTQEAVAAQVGITRPGYTNIETGERRPGVDMAQRIARVIGIDWTIFYSGKKASDDDFIGDPEQQ